MHLAFRPPFRADPVLCAPQGVGLSVQKKCRLTASEKCRETPDGMKAFSFITASFPEVVEGLPYVIDML
jgi:hypothetical protein